jgi:hypothetical protein
MEAADFSKILRGPIYHTTLITIQKIIIFTVIFVRASNSTYENDVA